METVKFKEGYQLHPQYQKVYIGHFKNDQEGSLGSSSFAAGEEIYCIICKREGQEEWFVTVLGSDLSRDNIFSMEDAKEEIELNGKISTRFTPAWILQKTIDIHNRRVW